MHHLNQTNKLRKLIILVSRRCRKTHLQAAPIEESYGPSSFLCLEVILNFNWSSIDTEEKLSERTVDIELGNSTSSRTFFDVGKERAHRDPHTVGVPISELVGLE